MSMDNAAGAAGVADASPVDAPDAPSDQGGDDAPAAGGAAPRPGETAKEAAARVAKWKVKIDGQEEDVEVGEDEVRANFQKWKAADKRMQEAAKIRQQAERFVAELRRDPIAVLSNPKLGLTPQQIRETAERFLAGQLEEELLTPEERDRRTRDQELEAYRAKEREAAKAAEESRYRELQQKAEADYTQKFTNALSSAGVPKTPFTVKRMAQYQLMCNRQNLDVTPEQLAAKVREDYIEEQKALFGSTDGDTLLQLLGDDVAGKLREADLKRHRSRNSDGTFASKASDAASSGEASAPPSERRIMNRAEVMRSLRRG